MANIIFGVILILLGLSAIFGGWIFKILFAALLIALGIKMIIAPKNTEKCHWRCCTRTMDTASVDILDETVVFGSLCKNVSSDNFKGGKVTVVFGGGTLDLSNAKTTEKNINLEVVSVFGGLKIIVPATWTVNLQNTAVLGGCDNRTQPRTGDTVFTLTGSTILGGIQLIN